MMTYKYLLSAATVGISALALASCGGSSYTNSASSSSGAKPASSGGAPMVSTAKTPVGTVVVNGSGRTLYLFEKDTGRKSTCNGICAANWPPFVTSSTPKTAGGVRSSALSLVKRSDGRRQVTLDGHPLYYFKGDQSPGQLNGQGLDAFGAKWFTLSSAGKTITAAPSSSSGSGSSSGGSYGSY